MNESENYTEVTSTQKRQILHILSLVYVGFCRDRSLKWTGDHKRGKGQVMEHMCHESRKLLGMEDYSGKGRKGGTGLESEVR